jgi:SAM-dependent methyltransferase
MLVSKKIRKKFPSFNYRIHVWSQIYERQRYRWGLLPSLTAHMALADIENYTKGKGILLDVGCGYCRDLLLFQRVFPNMTFDGLEPAESAVKLARSIIPEISLRKIICSDIFEFGKQGQTAKYTVVYANHFIHLFKEKEQIKILKLIHRLLWKNGVAILSWISSNDRHYGKGYHLDDYCYEVYKGIPWRFVNRSEVETMVSKVGMKVLKLLEFTEVELMGGKPDCVQGIYLLCTKDN